MSHYILHIYCPSGGINLNKKHLCTTIEEVAYALEKEFEDRGLYMFCWYRGYINLIVRNKMAKKHRGRKSHTEKFAENVIDLRPYIKVCIENMCVCSYENKKTLVKTNNDYILRDEDPYGLVYRNYEGKIFECREEDTLGMFHSALGSAICSIVARKHNDGRKNVVFMNGVPRIPTSNETVRISERSAEILLQVYEFNGNWKEYVENTYTPMLFVYFDFNGKIPLLKKCEDVRT